MSLARGYSLNWLYASANGSTVFIIPSDVIKSSGIINPVDPLASAYNLYVYNSHLKDRNRHTRETGD